MDPAEPIIIYTMFEIKVDLNGQSYNSRCHTNDIMSHTAIKFTDVICKK